MVLPLLIAVAFLQYAASSRAPSHDEPRRSRLGHWNGIAYYVALAVPVIRDALGLAWPTPPVVHAFGWLLVVSTLVSIAGRLRVAPSPE